MDFCNWERMNSGERGQELVRGSPSVPRVSRPHTDPAAEPLLQPLRIWGLLLRSASFLRSLPPSGRCCRAASSGPELGRGALVSPRAPEMCSKNDNPSGATPWVAAAVYCRWPINPAPVTMPLRLAWLGLGLVYSPFTPQKRRLGELGGFPRSLNSYVSGQAGI